MQDQLQKDNLLAVNGAASIRKPIFRDTLESNYLSPETGVEHGRAVAKIGMSMAYERDAEGIDRRFEHYFIQGVRALLKAAPLMPRRSEGKRTESEHSVRRLLHPFERGAVAVQTELDRLRPPARGHLDRQAGRLLHLSAQTQSDVVRLEHDGVDRPGAAGRCGTAAAIPAVEDEAHQPRRVEGTALDVHLRRRRLAAHHPQDDGRGPAGADLIGVADPVLAHHAPVAMGLLCRLGADDLVRCRDRQRADQQEQVGLQAVAHCWLCAAVSSSAIMAAQSASVPTHWNLASGGSCALPLILPMAPART